MTSDQALALLRLVRAQNELYDLWQKLSDAQDKEAARQYDRIEKLIDQHLSILEQPVVWSGMVRTNGDPL